MLYEQRPPAAPLETMAVGELWCPGDIGNLDVVADDHYVAIDEQVGRVLGLTFCRWPHVDAAGRLWFPDDIGTMLLAGDVLQASIDAHRARHRQTLRPLRIGDAFWVRGFAPDPQSWVDLVDITASARDAAKVAVFGTASGVVEADAASELGLVRKAEASERREPPPSGPVVSSAI